MFASLINHRNGMVVTLFVLLTMVLVALVRRDRSSASRIDLDDLLIGEDGRASKGALVMYGAFILTSWLMVDIELSGKMSEGYFVIYGGLWITHVVARLITNRPAQPGGTTNISQANAPGSIATTGDAQKPD